MGWVACSVDIYGKSEGPLPTEPGQYKVLISGDSEQVDGYVIYEFADYETWVRICFDEGEPELMYFDAWGDECVETMLAWYGPVDVPKCDCF